MNDSLLVGCLQRSSNISGDPQRFFNWHRPLRDPLCESRAFEQFHDEKIRSDIMKCADIGVI